eukprot:scaffold27165_cov35-Cyclotella_meneghiniana.AAC.2
MPPLMPPRHPSLLITPPLPLRPQSSSFTPSLTMALALEKLSAMVWRMGGVRPQNYVYAAVRAQLRQFDTSNVDSTNHSNGLADHNVSFLSPTRITTRGHQVLKFVCLKTGYWHCKFEYLCSTGTFPLGIPSNHPDFPACQTNCPYCDGTYDKQFKPVDYSVLMLWLSGPVIGMSFQFVAQWINWTNLATTLLIWFGRVRKQSWRYLIGHGTQQSQNTIYFRRDCNVEDFERAITWTANFDGEIQ